MSEYLLPGRFTAPLRRLYRDPDNGWLLGVCIGLAHWLRVDPLPVRVAALIGVVTLPLIFSPLYLLLGVLLPRRALKHDDPDSERRFWGGKLVEEDGGDRT